MRWNSARELNELLVRIVTKDTQLDMLNVGHITFPGSTNLSGHFENNLTHE